MRHPVPGQTHAIAPGWVKGGGVVAPTRSAAQRSPQRPLTRPWATVAGRHPQEDKDLRVRV